MSELVLVTSAGSKAVMQERMQHFHIPGVSVTLIDNNKVEWAQVWGQADSDSNTPLREEHLLYACSMTKFITAMTAVALAQANIVDLDVDVNELLTNWQYPRPTPGGKVSLRLLLSHQAGIIDGEDCFLPLEPGQEHPTLIQVMEGRTPVNTKPLRIEGEPGSALDYSDNGYCLVQQVLEDVTGKPLAQLAAEYIFLPLGMKHSRISTGLPPTAAERFGSGHEPDGSVTPGRYPVYPFPAAAGLWCTSQDLATAIVEVMDALQGRGKVLSPDSARAMVIPHNRPYGGLGNFSEGEGSDRQIYHLGWGKGFQCAFLAWPWRGQGAVIMTNSQPGMPQDQSLVGEVVRGLARECSWGEITGMLS